MFIKNKVWDLKNNKNEWLTNENVIIMLQEVDSISYAMIKEILEKCQKNSKVHINHTICSNKY